MNYQRKMKNVLLLISFISMVITAIFTFVQVKNPNCTMIAIFNNIVICILTGCVIALVQFFIGYQSEKRNCILILYKDCIMLEEAVIHYPFERNGFINPIDGLKDVRAIINLYLSSLKLSYMQIDIFSHKHLTTD